MKRMLITAVLAVNTSVFAIGFNATIAPNCNGLSASNILIGATNTILAVAPSNAVTTTDYIGFYSVTNPTVMKLMDMGGGHSASKEITFNYTKPGEYFLQYFNAGGVGLSAPFPFRLRSSSEISVETSRALKGDYLEVVWNTEFCNCVSITGDTVGYYDKDNPSSFVMIPLWEECYDWAYFLMNEPGRYVFGYFKKGDINNNLSPREVVVSALDLLTPPAGMAVGSTQLFSWTSVAGASQYVLYVGSLPGTNDLARMESTGSQVTVTNIPQDGRTLYVRIWYNVSGVWKYEDFTAQSAAANTLPVLGIEIVPALNIQAPVGYSYKLQYVPQIGPTNVWADLAVLAVTNQPQYYVDFSAIGKPSRFYRLVKLP